MKLYMHPISTTSRPVLLFAAENGITLDLQVVDLMAGDHHKEAFTAINPNRMVPVLEDGDFRLTESSAILKYLADKYDLPSYPKELKRRARVNEMMDWLNANFYRDFGYGLIYPQLFPHHKRLSEEAHEGTIAWGRTASGKWLQLLNDCWIGPDGPYLTGADITIADHFGACLVTLGEAIHCDIASFRNVARWIANMKALDSWPKVNEVFDGWVQSTRGQRFVTL